MVYGLLKLYVHTISTDCFYNFVLKAESVVKNYITYAPKELAEERNRSAKLHIWILIDILQLTSITLFL